MNDDVTAPEFGGVVGGGSSAGGHYVYLVIRLADHDIPMLIEKSRVGDLMLGLATAAGMARRERLLNDPSELDGHGRDAAYALKLAGATVGRSSVQDVAIIDLMIDAGTSEANLYLAGGPTEIGRLRAACDRAIALLGNGPAKTAATN